MKTQGLKLASEWVEDFNITAIQKRNKSSKLKIKTLNINSRSLIEKPAK
jgi:hypothetical protein